MALHFLRSCSFWLFLDRVPGNLKAFSVALGLAGLVFALAVSSLIVNG